jgi:hypothetical protein
MGLKALPLFMHSEGVWEYITIILTFVRMYRCSQRYQKVWQFQTYTYNYWNPLQEKSSLCALTVSGSDHMLPRLFRLDLTTLLKIVLAGHLSLHFCSQPIILFLKYVNKEYRTTTNEDIS